MRHRLLTTLLSVILLFATASPGFAAAHYRTRAQYLRHKRRVRTAKRIGVGAAGGAAIGALAGGGTGAAIGAVAGGGAGALYDRHKRHQRRRRYYR